MESLMKRLVFLWFLIFISVTGSLGAAVANEKTIHISKVESAVVSSIRQLSEQDLERDRNRNWALFGNSLLGGPQVNVASSLVMNFTSVSHLENL